MSKLPFEDEYDVCQWLEFYPHVGHNTWRDSSGVFHAQIALIPKGSGSCRQEAIVESVRNYCTRARIPLPFRPRPDLSTVENCIRAITDVGGYVRFSPIGGANGAVTGLGKCGTGKWFGSPRDPWTLEALQEAAKYVLGIED